MILTKRLVVLGLLFGATIAPAAAAAFKDLSSTSCGDYAAKWNTPAGARLTKPIVKYIYDRAGDSGASLGNDCGVAEYVAVVCKTTGKTVADAVKELLRRQAKGIEPPEPKACPP